MEGVPFCWVDGHHQEETPKLALAAKRFKTPNSSEVWPPSLEQSTLPAIPEAHHGEADGSGEARKS